MLLLAVATASCQGGGIDVVPSPPAQPDPALPVAAVTTEPPRPMPTLPPSETEGDGTAGAQDLRWVHPLAGMRQLPGRASRVFGAHRDGPRPAECLGGHCGVDIGGERGSVVHAAADGVIARINDSPWGKAGRYVILDHGDGVETA